MRHHRELFENVRTRTDMYLRQGTYAVVAAFVCGYDEAGEGGVLAGFREWLVVRLGTGTNLSWPALVLHAAFPHSESPQDEPSRSPESERHAIETLFGLIAEFDEARAKREGLREILVSYDRWVQARGMT